MKGIGTIRRAVRSPLVLGVLALASIAGSALADVTVSFTPLHGVFSDDDTLTVAVTVDDQATDLRGFTLVLAFDPNIVYPAAVLPGELMTDAACPYFFYWLNQGAIGDSLAIDGATLGCSMSGPGTIAYLKWVGLNEGTSPLGCRRGTLRDSYNATIPHTCVDGTITYFLEPPIPVMETRWSTLKALYRP